MDNKMEESGHDNNQEVISRKYTVGKALRDLGIVTALGASVFGMAGCGDGSKKATPEELGKAVDSVEKVGENLTEHVDNVAEEFANTASGITRAQEEQGEVLEKQSSVLENHNTRISEAEGKYSLLDEKVDKTNNSLDETRQGLDEARGNLEDYKEETSEQIEGLGERVSDVEDSLVDPATGRRFEFNNYSLTRTPEGEGRERITLFKENNPVGVIDIRKYSRGDTDFLVSWDTNGNGQIEDNEHRQGLYDVNSAKLQTEKLDEIIRSLENAKTDENKEGFEAALADLKTVGLSPTFGVLDSRVRDVIELFRHVEETGTYKSDNSVSLGDYLSREDVSIVSSTTRNRKLYSVKAGNEFLMDITVQEKGFKIVDHRKKVDGNSASAEFEVPEAYRTELVEAFAAGNQRGKDAALQKAEEERQAAEDKKKAEEQAAKEKAERERQEGLDDDLTEAYGRGARAAGEIIDDKNATAEASASFGGRDWNALVHGGYRASNVENNGETRTGDSLFARLRGSIQLGNLLANATKDERARLSLELFGWSDESTTNRPGSTEIVTDGSGRFTTTTQIDKDMEEFKRKYGSLFIGLESGDDFFNVLLYGGQDRLISSLDGSVTIHDNLGIIVPDIVNLIDVNVKSTVGFGGLELFTGLKAGQHLFAPLVGYEWGDIKLDDGTTQTDLSFSEFRLGLFYKFDKFLTAGGVYSHAEGDVETTDGFDLYAGLLFPLGNQAVVAPRAGCSISNGEGLFEGGLMLALGGSGKSPAVLDKYLTDKLFRDNSRQYTGGVRDSLDNWAWNDVLRNADSNILLNLGLAEVYGKDGEKGLGAEARLAFLLGIDGSTRFGIEPFYRGGPDGEQGGIALGVYHDKGFIKFGYSLRGGDLRVNDKDDGHTFLLSTGIDF